MQNTNTQIENQQGQVAKTEAPEPIFYILDNKAHMPNKCYGAYNYRKIAVMKSTNGKESRNIVDTKNYEIISCWDRVYDGVTDDTQAARARSKAVALLERLQSTPFAQFWSYWA